MYAVAGFVRVLVRAIEIDLLLLSYYGNGFGGGALRSRQYDIEQQGDQQTNLNGTIINKKEALCAYVYTMYKLSNGHQFFFNLALDGLRISIILLELKFTDQ